MNMIIKHDSRWQRWRFECVHRKIPTDERKKNSKCNGEERQRDMKIQMAKLSHI